MKKIDPLELFLWTFRRNEKDVVNLYDSLSDVMRLTTGGDMLNFGFWNEETLSPISAQKTLCEMFGKIAQLKPGLDIVDIGSGLGSPAIQWSAEYNPIKITCININFDQLKNTKTNSKTLEGNQKIDPVKLNLINSTSTKLPFENNSFDRVLALESAQHFKPLRSFFSEVFRILKKDGLLALAIPVMVEKSTTPLMKLGILSMTWSSEHYSIDFVKSLLNNEGFRITEFQKIGSSVYEPLANYYIENRISIKNKILEKYPSYVEKVLFKSLVKMKDLSQKKVIDYLLITCQK